MINIKNLSYGYSKQPDLLKNIHLNIRPGSIYGLLGKNGVGKSTLLHLMSGLLQPYNGVVIFDGQDVFNRKVETLTQIFMVPEEFELPEVSGAKFINLYAPFYPHFDFDGFSQNLENFNLTIPNNLNRQSMGEKKKFLISFAIATGCPLILMDEPTNGLDIPAKSAFRKIIASAMTEKRSFVISTHQVRDLEQIIDHVLILDQKEIIFNHSIFTIQDQLCVSQNETFQGKSFYSVKSMGISHFLVPKNNTLSENESIDFELLFNAVMANSSIITNHLKNNSNHGVTME
jgi:ABC-2 type transport system ATP-binding protein